MKNFALILTVVIGSLSLQSCFKSKSQIKSEQRATAPKTTAIKDKNTILIDTTIAETNLFITKVDDETGLAYGHVYQFDNAQATEIQVVVPYDCIRFDDDLNAHFILVKPFVQALANNDDALAFVERKQLVGYDTRK